MSDEVKIRITIEDNGSSAMKTIGVNAGDLQNAIKHVKTDIDELNTSVVNFAQTSQSIDAVAGLFNQARDAVRELSGIYSLQVEAETKLGVAMRNTMGATEADIQSIKDLCSAQQELGVIGDEVQLAGAQELATYLSQKESLEKLIPVLNDMTAQQYGLNATQESAAQIASMLGKVMEGQTSALSRYGYSFDEAQEEILKFGSESERAAVLAEVVGQSVGGMNAALGQTDAGKQKQLSNAIGDIQEQIGKVTQSIQPYIESIAEVGNYVGGFIKISQAIKTLNAAQTIASVKSVALATHMKMQALAQNLLAASGYTAAAGTTALAVATTALYAALTLGISVVITTIVTALAALNGETERYVGDTDKAKDAAKAFDNTVEESSAHIQMEIARLKGLKDGTSAAVKKVEELNSRYGDSFGYHKNAAEWYDVLVSKSQAYCQQLGYEAQAKVIASQKAAKEMELQANTDQMDRIIKSGKNSNDLEYRELSKQNTKLVDDIVKLGKQFDSCMDKARAASAEMDSATISASASMPAGDNGANAKPVETYEAGTLGDIEAKIQELQNKRKHANLETIAGINDEIAKLQEEKKALEDATNVKTVNLPEVTLSFSVDNYAEGTLGDIQQQLEKLEKMRLNALGDDLASINEQIKDLQQKSSELRGETITPEVEMSPMKRYRKVIQDVTEAHEVSIESMKGIGSTMTQLGSAVGGAAGEWLTWGGNLLSAIASAIPQILALTAAQNTQATANTASAATGAASSVASIPFVGPVLAVAAVASVLASLANLPKFANGTVAYGPTLGLFGEYAGASSNPEIVTPEKKMREVFRQESQMTVAGSGNEKLTFRIRGRDLEATRTRRSRLVKRS